MNRTSHSPLPHGPSLTAPSSAVCPGCIGGCGIRSKGPLGPLPALISPSVPALPSSLQAKAAAEAAEAASKGLNLINFVRANRGSLTPEGTGRVLAKALAAVPNAEGDNASDDEEEEEEEVEDDEEEQQGGTSTFLTQASA